MNYQPIREALRLIRRAFSTKAALDFYLPVSPVPASRPRVSRWGTYYAKTYKKFREQAQEVMPEIQRTFTGPLAVVTEFVVARPKTTKRDYPRGDNDNYEKAGWDAITSADGVWEDDDQIVFNTSIKIFDDEDGRAPGIYFTVYALEGHDDPTGS